MNADLPSRLKEVLLEGHWIANTNFQEELRNTTWQQAVARVEGLNTVAALTYLVHYYFSGLLEVFNGRELLIKDNYSFEMPEVKSELDWQRMVEDFVETSNRFIEKVASLSEAQLSSTFVKPEYGTYARNIEAQIEHAYYHLGQISLIRKLLLTSN